MVDSRFWCCRSLKMLGLKWIEGVLGYGELDVLELWWIGFVEVMLDWVC